MTKQHPLVTKKKNRRIKRLTTEFLRRGVEKVNAQIYDAYKHVTNEDKFWETYERITPSMAEDVFTKYKGRCVYCDRPLGYLGRKYRDSAVLAFYVPLKYGGEARVNNLVITCSTCNANYHTVRKFREDITGVDTFADLCEQLFKAIISKADEETVRRLKNRLNTKLADIATCMRYVYQSDWAPTHNEIIKEEKNTIGERLEDLAEGQDVKKEITNDMKQIITTKQYKIIRDI